MRGLKLILVLAGIMNLLLPYISRGQDKKVIELGEVVVTATRSERQKNELPASVTVIGPKVLAASPAKTVDDVLRSQAGLDFWGNDLASGGFSAVTMRGTGGSNDQGRTLILVDGLPINDTWDGNVAWSQIAKEDVERIEIVRGPASALYGGSAMGGVINIITKMPTKKPLKFRAEGGYGSLGRYVGYGNVSGTSADEKIGYYFSGKKDENTGYKAIKNYDGPYETKADHHIYNLMGKLSYFIDSNSNITLSSRYFQEKRNRGFEYSNTNPRIIKSINATYHRNVSDGLNMLASVYYQKQDQTAEYDNSTKIGSSPPHSLLKGVENYYKPFYGVILQPSYAINDWNTLTAGFEYKRSELKHHRTSFGRSTTYQDTSGKQEYYALYGQDEAFLLDDRLILSLGARMDWWRNFDGAAKDTNPRAPLDKNYPARNWTSFNPKFGLAFHPTENSTLRGAVGTGYRAPTPARMYTNLRRGQRIIEGNPNLDPEKVVSYELGADYQIGSLATISLTGYYTQLRDLISSRTIIPGRLLKYGNIGKVSTKGIEVETISNFHRFWRGYANFTYNESKIEEDEETPTNEGNYLELCPKIKFNVGLTFDRPDLFTASLQGRFVDKMYTDNENTEKLDSYWTMDFKISRKFFDMATVDFSVENIFDTKYDWQRYRTIYEAPGTLFMLGLTIEY